MFNDLEEVHMQAPLSIRRETRAWQLQVWLSSAIPALAEARLQARGQAGES